ncbi:MAG: ADP-dependent NAD(P)H-hydrate dehydratase / NAD(P)H-hydrate epimerase [Solirubrobacteraceae bacterium]|jgi:NAD(P)H-hydrate epimerase|nr:ADP-dependent NAD(P)H-hydrate dehydratase / NAD(P)H-hydrate epimerase [Solirubrobacteraceae bacterium]
MLPAFLEPLPDAPQMRAIDAWATGRGGVASLELMERAGSRLARLADELAPAGRIVVWAGKGNNGGDGLVAARLLRDTGRTVDVIFAADPTLVTGDARINLDRLPGEPPRRGPGPPAAGGDGSGDGDGEASLIVDALLGTGFAGEPRGEVGEAIAAINASGLPVLAADVPSGVDASSGEVAGLAVRAAATGTFHAAKPGLWIAPGKEHAGEVRVLDIGIPAGAPVEAGAGLIHPTVLGLIPRRRAASTKFESGHVVVAGGSAGLTGAPCLAAEAAMRAGAGYVTVAVPASLSLVFETRLLEVMTRALPDAEGTLEAAGVETVLELGRRGGALVLGPGLGRGGAEFARELARRAAVPVVLDADGLNAHAGRLEELADRADPTVLTPHDGELARLLGVERTAVAAARLEHVRRAAALAGAIVVLKGDDTLIAAPDGTVAVSPGGTPALATAGTGDVLSGVLGAMLAKGIEPFAAACAAVMLHLLAGRRAAETHGAEGVIASDVIAALPRSLV